MRYGMLGLGVAIGALLASLVPASGFANGRTRAGLNRWCECGHPNRRT